MINQSVTGNELKKQQVTKVLSQLIKDYQDIKSERSTLAQRSDDDTDFTVLEELALLVGDIRGFGCQVADTGRVQDVAAAIAHLKQLTVFDIPTIQKFYFDDSTEFEGIKRYINSLDYLRLLVLEYLQSTSVEETVAA